MGLKKVNCPFAPGLPPGRIDGSTVGTHVDGLTHHVIILCHTMMHDVGTGRCRANMAHIRRSRPDPGLDLQVTVLKMFPLGSKAGGANLVATGDGGVLVGVDLEYSNLRLRFRVWGLGFRVQGSGFRVYGLWFWVQGFRF